MPWIRMIAEEEAEGKLKEIYQELISKRGKLSNIMQVQSLNPEAMKAHMDLYLSVMFRRSGLSRAEREMMAVVVSAANRCDYCVTHHAMALDHYWKDEKRLRQLIEDFRQVDLTPRERALAEYAEALTLRPGSMQEAHVEALRKVGLSDEEILTANLVVAYFNFVNRIAMGLGVEFTPEEAAGYKY
ncbi:MAG: peroxidase [Calditrichaeota bacterium]|nr:MAG: peroxidase [Calditrichota bacterium]